MMRHPVPRYSILASHFNELVDQGHSMPIDEVKRRIEDRSLFDRLEELYAGDPGFDLSRYEPAELRAILSVFGSMANAIDDGKLGIARNGLGLCLGYCIEVMQSPEGHVDFDEK
jgi:hypothetical protein